jgi:hypothetical protein
MTSNRNPADPRAAAGVPVDPVASGDENRVSRLRLFVWGKFFTQRLTDRVRQIHQFLHEGR